jgi:hypothetical protein
MDCRPAGPLGPGWAGLGKGFSPFVLLQNLFFRKQKQEKRRVSYFK